MKITKEILQELGFHYHQEVWGVEEYKIYFKIGEDTECHRAEIFETSVEFLRFGKEQQDTFRYHGQYVYKIIETVEELIRCLFEDTLERGEENLRREIVKTFKNLIFK